MHVKRPITFIDPNKILWQTTKLLRQDLCLKVLPVQGYELRLFGAKQFTLLNTKAAVGITVRVEI